MERYVKMSAFERAWAWRSTGEGPRYICKQCFEPKAGKAFVVGNVTLCLNHARKVKFLGNFIKEVEKSGSLQ